MAKSNARQSGNASYGKNMEEQTSEHADKTSIIKALVFPVVLYITSPTWWGFNNLIRVKEPT